MWSQFKIQPKVICGRYGAGDYHNVKNYLFFSYGDEDQPQKNRSTTIQERFQLEEALDLIPQKEPVPCER